MQQLVKQGKIKMIRSNATTAPSPAAVATGRHDKRPEDRTSDDVEIVHRSQEVITAHLLAPIERIAVCANHMLLAAVGWM
jgi:hypothetical protein